MLGSVFRMVVTLIVVATGTAAAQKYDPGASDTEISGYWSTPKGDERALVWTVGAGDVTGVELHPAEWQKSVAIASGGGQQIGYGYKKFVSDPSRALLWNGTRESMVVLMGPTGTPTEIPVDETVVLAGGGVS